MSDYVIEPQAIPSVEVAGSGARFPVRRIFCVGQNYAAHAAEMGSKADPESPVFFTKPADAVVADGAAIPYPPLTSNLHHEVELVVAIGTGGAGIARGTALDHVFGYAVGIDLTRRDLQARAKSEGKPWDWAKAFDHSAPLGAIRRAAEIGHPARGRIALSVDGAIRQEGDLADMITGIAGLIAAISEGVTLAPGDLIFTGTPAGVGPLARGARVEAEIEGVGRLAVSIRA